MNHAIDMHDLSVGHRVGFIAHRPLPLASIERPHPVHPQNHFPPLFTSEPCLALYNSPGPTVPTLQRSLASNMWLRGIFSSEGSRARCFMVRQPVCPPNCAHSACSICHSRVCRRPILPMHVRVAQSRALHKWAHKMGARGSHCGYVLVCNHKCRNEPRSSIIFLRREAQLLRLRRAISFRTSRIPGAHLFQANQCCSPPNVLLGQLAGRRPFGKFWFELSRSVA